MYPEPPRTFRDMMRRLLTLAVPLIISTGSFTVMQFVDRMFLSWHSPEAARAGLPAGFLALNFLIGLMSVVGITSMLVAQFEGAGRPDDAARATAQGIWLSLATWPVLLLLIPVGFHLIKLSGHPPEVAAQERIYFGILLAGGVASVLKSAFSGFFSGLGHTRVVMWSNVACNGLNILLDYVLIFGKWGFPELGIAGAAIATVTAECVCVVVFLLAYVSPRYAPYGTRRHWRLDTALLRKLIRFGLPAGIHLTVEFAAFTIFLMLTGRLDAEETIASNIALNINHVAVMPILGISFAVTTLVGQFQGARDHARARQAGWAAVGLGQCFMLCAAATFVLMPDVYVQMFAHGEMKTVDLPRVYDLTTRLLLILAAWGLFDTFSLVLAGALRGAGDTRFVMWYSIGVAWLLYIPGLVLLHHFDRVQLLPMWMWTAAWVVVLASGFILRFRRGKWESIEVVDTPPSH